MRTHRYAVGQHVSYVEAHPPNDVRGGRYEIVFLLPAGDREPQYQIRSDDQIYDQVVSESQLQEEFGRRKMRLSKRSMRTVIVLASPDRRVRQNRNELEKPSQYQDLKRWDDEGGAPRSGRHFSESPPSQVETKPALYYFNVRTETGLIEDPEGDVYADLQAARAEALVMAREMIAKGELADEDRRGRRIEIMDRSNQLVLTVMFPEALDPKTNGMLIRLHRRNVAATQEGEPRMSKDFLGAVQGVVNAVWKAVRRFEGQPTRPSKVKLDGRRGYGDDGIPSPRQKPDAD